MINAAEIRKIQQDNEQNVKTWIEQNCLPILEKLILKEVRNGRVMLKLTGDEMPWSEKQYGGARNPNWCGKKRENIVGWEQFINGVRQCLNSYGYSLEIDNGGGLSIYIIRW